MGPTSSACCRVSSSADAIASRVPKVPARIWAVRSPTKGIPRPESTLAKPFSRERPMLATSFSADLAPMRSRGIRSSTLRL